MNIDQIREIARSHGIKAGKMAKTALIRNIQTREGNFDCFATAYDGFCDQGNCLWREDCLALAARRDAAA